MDTEPTILSNSVEPIDLVAINAEALSNELSWFTRVIHSRLYTYFPSEQIATPAEPQRGWLDSLLKTGTAPPQSQKLLPRGEATDPASISAPDLSDDHSIYAEFVKYYKLSPDERLLLMLAITPHIQPHLLDVFFSINKSLGRGYTEFGGITTSRQSGFIPTIETALFILAGNDLHRRFQLYRLFEPTHVLIAHGILVLDPGLSRESFYSSTISISEEYIDYFTTGTLRKPQFSMDFPAKRLTTQMEWDDLVIDDYTARQLEDIRTWLLHGRTLLDDWGLSKKIKPGYKTLFHGPPGTGKTLTAALLGKQHGLDVYRIDLSMVIDKYIGQTEKNLEKVFSKAENKNWILLFDEADALFGKRTNISDAHDKYANQECAYLLQRLEDYSGLVILASNMRSNVDEAFTRRLQTIIHFPKPLPQQRLRLWKNAFSAQSIPPSQADLERLAKQFDLSGGAIMNVVQYASLMALNRGETAIATQDLIQGATNELRKDGKTI